MVQCLEGLQDRAPGCDMGKRGTSLPALVVRGVPKKASIHSLAGPAVKAAAVVPAAVLRHRPVQAAAGTAAAVEHSAALQQRCQVVAQLLHVNNGPAGPVARHRQAACSMILALGHGLAVQGEACGSLHSHKRPDGSITWQQITTWQHCPLRNMSWLSKGKGASKGKRTPQGQRLVAALASCKQLDIQGKASKSLHCDCWRPCRTRQMLVLH